MQLAPYYSSSTRSRNQHLQLIQETAPLAAPAVAADQLARPNIGQHQQHDLKWLAAGVPLAVSGSGASSGSGGGMLLSTVSRRISPILSVVEDGSSATSNDSLAGPAAWHLADRHLLMEDTPVSKQDAQQHDDICATCMHVAALEAPNTCQRADQSQGVVLLPFAYKRLPWLPCCVCAPMLLLLSSTLTYCHSYRCRAGSTLTLLGKSGWSESLGKEALGR